MLMWSYHHCLLLKALVVLGLFLERTPTIFPYLLLSLKFKTASLIVIYGFLYTTATHRFTNSSFRV